MEYDDDAAIPMNKTKPTTILFAVGAVVLVIGALVFTFAGGKKKAAEPEAAATQAAPTSTLTPEEQKQHLEITRRSLEAFAAAEAEKKKKAGGDTKTEAPAAPAGGAPAAAAPAGGSPAPASHPVAAAPAGGSEPAPKPAKKVSKKEASDLDGLKDIASQIGK